MTKWTISDGQLVGGQVVHEDTHHFTMKPEGYAPLVVLKSLTFDSFEQAATRFLNHVAEQQRL